MNGENPPQFAPEERGPSWMPRADDPASAGPASGPPRPDSPHFRGRDRGWILAAWIVIVLTAAGAVLLPKLLTPPAAARAEQDALGLMVMRLQSRYIVGVAGMGMMPGDMAYEQTRASLNTGTVAQRQRFVVLTAELAGPEEAGRVLGQLDEAIEEERGKGRTPPFELTEDEVAVQAILHKLYPPQPIDQVETLPARVAGLSSDERDRLVHQLGWFGELALAPAAQGNAAAREDVLAPARSTAMALFGGIAVLGVGGIAGFIGLVVLLVMALGRRLPSRFGTGLVPHGIYAETFALWMAGFFVLQVFAGAAAMAVPGSEMLVVAVAFFLSLAALAWPVFRGASWQAVRQDIGLSLGPNPVVEPFVGIAGYFMALPLLFIGVMITFVLVLIEAAAAGPVAPFDPVGGPAHPVVLQLGGPDLWPKLQVLLVGAVAAPIVEETMFRGVLYRHLRDATGRFGVTASVLLAGTLNGFVFAIIHPQGLVAVPALMGLAYAFVMLREWRGSVVPSIIVHGISNGLVLTLLVVALGT